MRKPLVLLFMFLATILVSNLAMGQNFDFQCYQFDTDDGLPSSEIYDQYEDPVGNIWLATDRGVVKYNGYNFITYDMKNGLANLVNFSFQPVGDGTFWVNGLDGSLSYWDGQSFEPFPFNSAVKNIRPNKKSWLDFLGINDDLLFLHIISSNSTEITLPIYSVNICNGIINTHGEGFWDLLTNSKQSDQIIKRRINIIRNNKTVQDSIKNDIISQTHFQWDSLNQLKRTKFIGTRISGLYIDKNGGEWVTTNAGVLYFKNGNLSVEPIVFFKGVGVTSISESKNGSLWITSTDNGLFHIPNINIHKFRPKGWAEGETAYNLKNTGDYLLGRSEKGKIFLLDKNLSNSSGNNVHEVTDFNSTQSNRVNVSLSDSDFLFGVLPLENGNFLKYNTTGFYITSDLHKTTIPKYKFRALSSTKDTDETLWIATTEGLFKWETDYERTHPELVSIQGIKELRVNDVKSDRSGVWATTPRFGLVYKTEFEEHIVKHEKLRDKILHSVFKQNDTTLWVGSNRGLHKIKYGFNDEIPSIENIEVFTITHGLMSNYINDVTFWNDEIWLATDKGPCHFKPNQLSSISTIPSLQIDYLEAKNNKQETLHQIILNHNENDVSIAYTGISHNKPKKGFYRYKINDKPWKSTNERKVSFLDLNHGDYKFLVQCRSDSGIWSTTESLVFTVKPHLLEQFWFRAVAVFLLCIIVFLIIRLYRKGWKKKLENENRLRRSELTTLRNQMNPHFMFNSLTALQGLIYKGKKQEANVYIGNFSRLMRKSLEYSRLENISLEEELQFVKNYLELEKKRFKELFEYQIIMDPELTKTSPQIPPLLIQPLLENAIKHGFRRTSDNRQIEMVFKQHDINYVLEVIIKDNGVGFDLNDLSRSTKSMGLGIVKDRINLIRENSKVKEVSFHIESELGKGTIIRLMLPLNS